MDTFIPQSSNCITRLVDMIIRHTMDYNRIIMTAQDAQYHEPFSISDYTDESRDYRLPLHTIEIDGPSRLSDREYVTHKYRYLRTITKYRNIMRYIDIRRFSDFVDIPKVIQRSVVSRASLSVENHLEHTTQYIASLPLTKLTMNLGDEHEPVMIDMPHLPILKYLNVYSNLRGNNIARSMVNSMHAHSISLMYMQFSDMVLNIDVWKNIRYLRNLIILKMHNVKFMRSYWPSDRPMNNEIAEPQWSETVANLDVLENLKLLLLSIDSSGLYTSWNKLPPSIVYLNVQRGGGISPQGLDVPEFVESAKRMQNLRVLELYSPDITSGNELNGVPFDKLDVMWVDGAEDWNAEEYFNRRYPNKFTDNIRGIMYIEDLRDRMRTGKWTRS